MATTPIVTPEQFAVISIWGKNALRYRTPPADRGTRHEKRKSAMPFFNTFVVYCPMEALHVLLERFFEPQSKHDKLCTLLPWIHNLASPDESKSQSLQWWPQNVTYTYLKYKEASHDITDEDIITLAACVLRNHSERIIEEIRDSRHCAHSLIQFAKSAINELDDKTASYYIDEENSYLAKSQDNAPQDSSIILRTVSPAIMVEDSESSSTKSMLHTQVLAHSFKEDNTSQSTISWQPLCFNAAEQLNQQPLDKYFPTSSSSYVPGYTDDVSPNKLQCSNKRKLESDACIPFSGKRKTL